MCYQIYLQRGDQYVELNKYIIINLIVIIIINVYGCWVCRVGSCHKVYMEVRGHLCGVASLHGIHESDGGLQTYATGSFTCKVILLASAWSFYEELRSIGSRPGPCFSPQSSGQPLCHFYQSLGELKPWHELKPVGKSPQPAKSKNGVVKPSCDFTQEIERSWEPSSPYPFLQPCLSFSYVCIAYVFLLICF